MKKMFPVLSVAALFLCAAVGCDAFRKLDKSSSTSQGAPYELIVVCSQPEWEGALGDTLRTVLAAPVPTLNQYEPLFSLLHVTERGFTRLVVRHRNILKIAVTPEAAVPSIAVQYNVAADPQVVLTAQGASVQAVTDYISQNRDNLVYVLEKAERDRAVAYAATYNVPGVTQTIKEKFGFDMPVPKGYALRSQSDDFVWVSYEYPAASQGFMVYSFPYRGVESLSARNLIGQRNAFAARIPGPAEGSFMTTFMGYEPDCRTLRIGGRLWVEMRGFWDVEGDFMGGPFVSYATVDEASARVVVVDCYVYSPKNPKRNLLRGLEHLIYSIEFDDDAAADK